MRKKLYLKKAAAIGTAVVLACAVTGCGTEEATDTNETAESKEEDNLLETMNRITGSENTEGKTSDKEETVYVIADSEGQPTKVIVSEWLKNVSGSATIADFTNLTDITNVKGKEEYTNSSNGIVWKANGSDIYYQGESKEELPVSVKVTYYLDDEQIVPEKLAGKSGHIKIRYDYTNNSSKSMKIQDESTEIYTPFVMATGMILPTDTFQNVTVSNGNVISEGNNMIAFGVAMPGLSESLGMDNLDNLDMDLNLPDYFEVTADVENFSLGMSVTLCSNTLIDMSDFDFSDSMDDINGDMDTLTDGAGQLVDGSSQLYDGTNTLKNGTTDLSKGVNDLYDGVKTYTDGVTSAKNGAQQIAAGSDSLDDGAQTLTDKLGDAKNGSTQLKDGLGTLNSMAPALINGITAVQSGLSQIVKGYEGENGNAGALAGAKTVAGGLAQLNENVKALSLPDMSSQSSTLTDEQKSYVEQQVKEYLTGTEQGKAVLEQSVESYITSVKGLLAQNGVQLDAQTSAAMEAVMKGTFEQAFINIYISAYESGMEKGMGEVLNEVSGQLAGYAPLIEQMQGAVSQLASGSAVVADGVGQLYAGTKQVSEGADTMYDSAKGLPDGVSALYNGSVSLENGIGQLKEGAASLKSGTAALKTGTHDLVTGCVTLDSASNRIIKGFGDLKSGVQKLEDGAGELQSGALELKDGMVQFNEEGIQKLKSLVKDDLNHITDRMDAVSTVNNDYTLYGGIADGKSGTEKFIIKIDGIEGK